MGKQPLVSIILPAYSGSEYIKQSIDSCLAQTYKNIELIIVDDGLPAATVDIIKSYSDTRIIYIKHEKNLGLARALNTGFKSAKGEYLTWTSDDNFYAPEAIASMLDLLIKKQEVGFVYSNFYIIDEKGKIVRRRKVPGPRILKRYNCVGACFLYKRAVYERVGEFDFSLNLAEDWEYWLRIEKQFKIQKLNKFLYYYRFHENSLTSTHKIAETYEQMEKASSKYVSLPMRDYHKGRLFFYKKNYNESRKLLIKSLVRDPINSDAWKLLIFVCLNILSPTLAQKIKKIRD